MHKILITLFTLAALTVGAQTAVADVPATTVPWNNGTNLGARCLTGYQWGVYGQYGAWGDFIDGCTATVQCPPSWTRCTAHGTGSIYTRDKTGHRVTANARLRFGSSYLDASCSGIDWCYAAPWRAVPSVIAGGQWASLQCNGVRDEMIPDRDETLAMMVCVVELDKRA
jgi:hypothetical protein